MIDALYQYLTNHTALLGGLALFSIVIFLLGILTTPFMIAAIPDNYFDQNKRRSTKTHSPTIIAIVSKILKNLLGIILIIGGIAMILLPGQGILTLIIGLLLLDYPGKYHIEKKIASRPKILKLINWIRRKHNKKEFNL